MPPFPFWYNPTHQNDAVGGLFMQDENTTTSVARGLSARDFACVLGLSILFPYFRAFFLSIVKSAGIHSAPAFEGAFYTFAIAFALCAAATLSIGPRLTKRAISRKALLSCGALGSTGCLLLWLPALGAFERAQCIVGAVANIIFFTVCLLAYLSSLECFEPRRAALIVTLGFGLCFASNLFYVLPVIIQAALCVVSPFAAALCAPRLSQFSQITPKENGRSFSTSSLALCVLLVLFCVTGNFLRGVTNPWFDISDISVRTLYMSLVNVAFVCVTAVLLVRGASLNRIIFFNWTAYMLLFFAGVLAMTVAPEEAAHIGSNLATSARVAFTMLLVLFVITPERWSKMGLAKRASLFLLIPEALAALVRYIVVPIRLAQDRGVQTALVTYGGTAVIFILSTAIILMLGFLMLRSTEAHAQNSSTADHTASLTAAIAAQDAVEELVANELANRYGLTPREAEVVRCASQGHSLEKTAGLLGVSVNTVRTHNRSAYAKMGIHSRQEIIELATAVKTELAGKR